MFLDLCLPKRGCRPLECRGAKLGGEEVERRGEDRKDTLTLLKKNACVLSHNRDLAQHQQQLGTYCKIILRFLRRGRGQMERELLHKKITLSANKFGTLKGTVPTTYNVLLY